MATQETQLTNCIRSPICVVVGHVDHGKSSVLDYIRNTNIVAHEAGAITQAIGASIIPISYIKEKCGDLLKSMNLTFTIPGLLFIDTPGHAAFTSLRKRGGSLADIAILVIDINEGFKPQTVESIKILKECKTPFIIAANKIDLVDGYQLQNKTGAKSVLGNINNLSQENQKFSTAFETKMYEIVQKMYELGFPAERFDRVSDFTKEVAIVPTSAINGDGMGELLMVLSALTQKYLEKNLSSTVSGPAQGMILEVKEQKGLGTVLDAIVYDGTMKVNDTIVIGNVEKPIVTKIKALLQPSAIADMRDQKARFVAINQVTAATGVRISAPEIDNALAGMPFATCANSPAEIEKTKEKIMQEIDQGNLETDDEGVIIKADTIGGLEALLYLLKEAQIKVRLASVGQISKKDMLEAQSNKTKDPIYACILGFNIKQTSESLPDVHVITAPVIYKILDLYKEWKDAKEREKLQAQLKELPKLGKMQFMTGCSFRQNNPAIIGVQILIGQMAAGMQLMKADGSSAGQIKSLQENKTTIPVATRNMEVACSIDGVAIGRQIAEKDIFYTKIGEEDFLTLKAKKDILAADDREVLKEIAEIMRKQNPLWGL